MNLEKAAEAMERVGIPGGDAYDLPTSKKRFPDGAWYRMEVSGVERPNVLEALIDEMGKRNIAVHRLISVVMGGYASGQAGTQGLCSDGCRSEVGSHTDAGSASRLGCGKAAGYA